MGGDKVQLSPAAVQEYKDDLWDFSNKELNPIQPKEGMRTVEECAVCVVCGEFPSSP